MSQGFAEKLHLQGSSQGGKVVFLSDQSAWAIAPEDLAISSLWLLPAPIQVVQAEDFSVYPFLLTNLHSNTSVHASCIHGKQ
ncbi:MAG: hypothetical protein FJZ58_04935 [Chlamydiae bacterium]|nr:hypothetical protein [Chlamydiota bacterium]